MNKKILLIIIMCLTIFLLSACVPISAWPKLNQLKKEATTTLTNYLDKEYENYEIVDIEQFTDIENFDVTVSDVTKLIVKIDSKEYDFYYNHNTQDIYSNYYAEDISQGILSLVNKYDIPTDTISTRGYVTISDDIMGDFQATLCDDKTIKDILTRMKNDEDIYTLNADFYYEHKDNFNPYEIRIDTVFANFEKLNLNLYNVDKEYFSQQNPLYLLDVINYKMCDDNSGNIEVNYCHSETTKKNGFIFLYDNEVHSINLKENGQLPHHLQNIQASYNISVEYNSVSPPLYDEFLNEIGTRTIIHRGRSNCFSVFLEPSKWQNCKFYISNENKTKSFNLLDNDLKIFDFIVENPNEYKETITIFKDNKTTLT
jgi:hypothetical protein